MVVKMADAKAKENAVKSAKPPRQITLRGATAIDCTEIYRCLIRYFEECSMFYPEPVEADTMAWGLGVINKGGVIVAECEGKIIGSVGLELGIYPWNSKVNYLNGVWLWVLPEYRNGSTGVRLIKAAKEVADKNSLGLRLDEVWKYRSFLMGKLKERLGFHQVGGNWVYIPGDPNVSEAEA